jgi:branched-chain amino acid aminotransferase
MSEPFAYLNGSYLPLSQAALPLHDAGFVMGATVVDFVRTFRHQLDSWPAHLARFQNSVKEAGFPNWKHTDQELTAIARELMRRNAPRLPAAHDFALILFATPGRLGYYVGEPDDGQPTLGMHTFALPFERYRGMIQYGAWLRVPDLIEALPMTSVPVQIKHRSRMHWWLAEREVASLDRGASKPLLLNEAGHITETSFANIVIIKGNTMFSPTRDTILPGISLQTLKELCPEAGLTFRERDLSVKDCYTADEVLLCGTAFCLASVHRLNDTTFPVNGDVLTTLIQAWSARVGVDIHGQILNP